MLARVAENLYWLGRYLERADNIARMVDVHYAIAHEVRAGEGLETVLYALDANKAFEDARADAPELTPEDYLVFSPEAPVSIPSVVACARSLARELRDQISREVFEHINALHLALGRDKGRRLPDEIDLVRASVPAIFGLFENTVLWTEGARWFRVGVFVERADMTSRIIDVKYFVQLPAERGVGSALDRSQWRQVLRSASALEAYRKQHQGLIRVADVVDVLVFDPNFPRSVVFCLERLMEEFNEAAARTPAGRKLGPAKEITLLNLELRAATADDVIASGMHEFIDLAQARLADINDRLARELFHPDASPPASPHSIPNPASPGANRAAVRFDQ